MTEEKIGEFFFEIKATQDKLRADLNEAIRNSKKTHDEVNKNLTFKAKFDNGIAKLKLSELQKLQERLKKEFDKKVSMNVDSASLDRTRIKLASVNQQLSGVGVSAQSTGSKVLGMVAGLGLIAGTFTFISGSIRAAIDSAKAFAGVETAIKTTGGAAGFTAEELARVSKQLSEMSGVDDDDIMKNVTKQLLTFTNITEDSFLRAQKAVLDLNSVINDGSVSSLTGQSIQLGKALEDPIRGVTALSRAGVTFTQVQKDQIKEFVRQNDLLSAQNIILTEVENKYGNQAAAINGVTEGTQNLDVAWGDLKESIGQLFTPLLGKWLPEVTKGIRGWIALMQDAGEEFANMLKAGQRDKVKAYYDSLKGTTAEYRDQEKKRLQEEIELNKEQWKELKKKEELFKNQGDLGKPFLNSLYEQEKQISSLNSSLRAGITAIDKYNGDIVKTSKASIDSWTLEGKSIAEIEDRIADLTDKRKSYSVSDKEATTIKKEIENLTKIINGGSSSPEVNIMPKIPAGFTAEQVVEFEKLKFAIAGYVDFRKAQIESAYQFELLTAKENSSKIKQAEENKNLELAQLKSDLTDYNKSQDEKSIKQAQDFFNELEKITKDNEEKVKKQSEQYNLDKEKSLDDYYNNIKTKDESYFNYRIKQIQEQSEKLTELNDPIKAKQFEIDSIKELEQEYFEWRMAQWQEHYGAIADLQIGILDSMTLAYDTFWQTLADSDMTGKERLEAMWQSIKSGIFSVLGDIIKGYISNWVKSQIIGDTFRALEIAKGTALGTSLAAAYAPAATFASVMSFGGAAVAGETALTAAVATSQALSIPKFAQGSNGFQEVPAGYNNDDYLIRMKSGEDFNVRTPQQRSKDAATMQGIEKRLDILNANLREKNFSPAIDVIAELDGLKLTKQVISTINKIQKTGLKTQDL